MLKNIQITQKKARKERELKNRRNKHKTNKVTDLSPNISKMTFNLNDLNMQLKGRLSKWINQHNPSMLSIKISLQTLQHRWIKSESERVSCSVVSDSFQPYELQPTRFLCPWDSPGKNTGVACQALLQGIFPVYYKYLNMSHHYHISLKHLGHAIS